MSKKKMTDERIAQARKLRDEDKMGYREIAAILGVSPTPVCLALNPEVKERQRIRLAEYNKANKGSRRICDAERYKIDGERIREYSRKYHEARYLNDEAYRERICLRVAAYRKTHKPDVAAWSAARRALILGATIGNLAQIKEIYQRAKEAPKIRCYLCGELIPIGHRHVDHIIPVSKGGKHQASNLAVACDKCNQSKKDKLPGEVGVLI